MHTKKQTFMLSEETKTELFDHNDHCYVCRTESVNLRHCGGGSIMGWGWGCFTTGRTGAPHLDYIMKKEKYEEKLVIHWKRTSAFNCM